MSAEETTPNNIISIFPEDKRGVVEQWALGQGGTLEQVIVRMILIQACDGTLPNAIKVAKAKYQLADRETLTLQCWAEGLAPKQIADRMSIAVNTVQSFLRKVVFKMEVKTRRDIMAKLMELGNEDPDNISITAIRRMSRPARRTGPIMDS